MLIGFSPAFGEEPPAASDPAPAATVQERLDALEKKVDAPSLWKTLGFKVSGFVDIAYTHNFNNPSTNLNQLHIFDTNASSFMPHMAQLMIERPADAGGSAAGRAGFRARLNFGSDARVTRARTNYQPGVASDEMDLQELFAEYILPVGNGLKVQAGKINTLIGYEVINSWENANFSRSFMFGLGQAFTTTGIRLTYTFNPIVTASVGVVNGWDNVDDNNKGKTFEWLLALTPTERFGASFYGSVGRTINGGRPRCDGKRERPTHGGGPDPTFKATSQDTIVLSCSMLTRRTPFVAGPGEERLLTQGAYLIHDFNDECFRLRGEIF
jgi:hypothetical protein